jgi:hypothetical protein
VAESGFERDAPFTKDVSGRGRRAFVLPAQSPQPQGADLMGMDQGLITDASPKVIPLQASPNLSNVRFEQGGVRKDFGTRRLGQGPSGVRALALHEHKYFDGSKITSLLIHLFRTTTGKLDFYVWDGGSQVWKKSTGTPTIPISDTFLSSASFGDVLFVADGSGIFQWDETPPNPNREEEFPAGNLITTVGGSTSALVFQADSANHSYTVNYDITVNVVDLLISERTPWFRIEFLRNGVEVLGTRAYGALPGGSYNRANESFTVSRKLNPSDTIDIKVVEVSPNWESAEDTFSVHGHNKTTDGDASAGVTYKAVSQPGNAFVAVASAPGTRYVIAFRDRLIALGGSQGPDTVSWSVDGDPLNWVGDGSGQAALIDSRTDPLDEIMGAGAVASNLLAVFRRRSIMRARETGNLSFAVAWEAWIEGLGTDARFSIEQVADGVCFLGHDIMPYYFNGSVAPLPIGESIHTALLDAVGQPGTNQDEIDAAYDPVFRRYYLLTPRTGTLWGFDLGRFIEDRSEVWTRRAIDASRVAVASTV